MMNSKTLFRRCSVAFTLIELLIVVAIIGILATVALPNFLEARMKAERAQCAGNLHTLGLALALYRVDFNRYPPADGTAGKIATPGFTTVGHGPASNGSWDGVSRLLIDYGYLNDESALYCPTLRRRYKDRQEYFRYAYNNSAADTGGTQGGANDIFKDRGLLWLVRCLWLPPEISFTPQSGVVYPHGHDVERDFPDQHVMENVLMTDLAVHPRNGKMDCYTLFGLSYPQSAAASSSN